MWVTLFSVFMFLLPCQTNSQDSQKSVVALQNNTSCISESVKLYEGEILFINTNCSWINDSYAFRDIFQVTIKDEKVAILVDVKSVASNLSTDDHYIAIKGIFLGRTVVCFEYKDHRSKITEEELCMKISVIRKERIIDNLFVVFVTILMFLAYFGMGCEIDINTVKEVLKKPFAPIIGLTSQYVIMPLTAFAVVKMFDLTGGIALGFFASGCAPGGGASNMYTYLLGGDLSLSATMTLISTIVALGTFPLWLNTLGLLVYDTHGSPLKIPFQHIFTSLLVMICPMLIGVAIKIKKPRWAEMVRKITRPFFAIVIILLIIFGILANLYLLQLISPWLIIGACILSYSGFLLGGLLAFFLRLKWSRVIAVAIETGVQNTGLPIILLKLSLPQPDADLSVISPVTVAMLMPIPLWVAIAVLEIRKRCKGSSATMVTSESEVKVLKTSEMNGVHFIEVGDDKSEVNKLNSHDPEKGEGNKITCEDNNTISEDNVCFMPNGSGDSKHDNSRF